MQIQINTDHNIKSSHEFLADSEDFQKIVQDSLDHFQKHITRVDVHFSDENAGKTGEKDKRCLIEARVSGIQPIIAKHNANNLHLALEGAADKLKRSLVHTFGKMKQY
jgi:ribosomal subunit interface protein